MLKTERLWCMPKRKGQWPAGNRRPLFFAALQVERGVIRGFAPVPFVLQNLTGFTIYLQCLQGGRLGPPFFPAGKESAAGGVKKGGQGGLPMGPLDDPPTANKGGLRAPFFGLIPRGSVGAVPCECAGALAEFASACCGARRCAVARAWLEVGS